MKKALSIFSTIAAAIIVIVIGNIVIAAQDAPKPPDATIDSAAKTEAINVLLKELNDRYVFKQAQANHIIRRMYGRVVVCAEVAGSTPTYYSAFI